MNLFNPIQANIYYRNKLVNDIKKINKKREKLNPKSFIKDEELNKILKGSFVVIDKGRLKQVTLIPHPHNNLDLVFYNLLDEEITLKKLSKFDKSNWGVNYGFMIQTNFLYKYHKELFINLKWWEYWQIKIYKKDTYLHRIKLLDKIVFTLLGSIITILIGWLLSSW